LVCGDSLLLLFKEIIIGFVVHVAGSVIIVFFVLFEIFDFIGGGGAAEILETGLEIPIGYLLDIVDEIAYLLPVLETLLVLDAA
jgi:hypothetical protein